MNLVQKGLKHLRRLSNARRFGIPFTRRADFKMPQHIRVGSQLLDLSFPDEVGIGSDFLTCFIDDEYGLAQTEGPMKTIVDIGSNVGFFSMAARARFPEAEIHAYEPNPRIVGHFTKNTQSARVRAFPEAVGAVAGFVNLEDTGDSNQASTTLTTDSTNCVRQVALSDVIERLGGHVDLAKIDCEGAEWDMFTDAASWRAIRQVRMEYHLWGKHTFDEVQEAFRRLGFEIHHHAADTAWGTVWCRNLHWDDKNGPNS